LPPLFCELNCQRNSHEHGRCPEIAGAARFWLVRVLDHGAARLYCADEARGHLSAQREAGGAADSLLVASILADDPAHRIELRRLARQLLAALDVTGHPNGAELAAISSGAAAIRTALGSAGEYR